MLNSLLAHRASVANFVHAHLAKGNMPARVEAHPRLLIPANDAESLLLLDDSCILFLLQQLEEVFDFIFVIDFPLSENRFCLL